MEAIGGLLLLFATPGMLDRLIVALTRNELAEDPGDFIATRLLHVASDITDQGLYFASAYLLIHGGAKVVLVIALLRKQFWAYPWMIAMLVAFIAYQGYELAISPTAGLLALTAFDIAVTVLTWHEYLRRKHGHDVAPRSSHRSEPT